MTMPIYGQNRHRAKGKKKTKVVTIVEAPVKVIPTITTTPSSLLVSDEGCINDTITINSNFAWSVSVNNDGFLKDRYEIERSRVIFNIPSNPSYKERVDTLFVKSEQDTTVVEKVVIRQQPTPIVMYFCIDGDDRWYNTKEASEIPTIELAKYKDEYRSVQIVVTPEEARENYLEKMKMTLPEWCELQHEKKDKRGFVRKSLGIGDSNTGINSGEIYFKSNKQQKKKGTSGIVRKSEIRVEYEGTVLSIPVLQNQ